MDHDFEKNNLFQRRAFLIGGLKGLLLTGIFARMSYLQVFNFQKYKMMADDNRINVRSISPNRGFITGLNDEILAGNDQNFRAFLLREKTGDAQATLKGFAKILHLDESEIERMNKVVAARRGYHPILIKENMSWNQLSKIQYALPHLPGIFIDVGEVRTYPQKDLLSHIIGYVGAVQREEQAQNANPIYSVPGIKLGRTGLEKGYDQFLRGKPGVRQIEVNALGRLVRELSYDPGEPGQKLKLTIDLALQNRVYQILESQKSASCMIMDVHTGAVYASVSHPSYDPNLFVRGLSDKVWQSLVKDKGYPLTNKIIAGQYSPGSLFKMVVAMAALENKIVTKRHQVNCIGYIDSGNQRFHCVHRKGCGVVGFQRALQRSCDSFFYDLGQKLTIDQIAVVARRFGYGQSFNLGLTGEKSGLMPDRAWKMKRHKKAWMTGDTINASIGQGFILSSPIQIAVMMSRLVNGGHAVIPRFVHSIEGQKIMPPSFPPLDFDPENQEIIRRGMVLAMQGDGTGARAQLDDPFFQLGGKTATTQVKRITMEERERGVFGNADRIWEHRDHAMMTTFAPTNDPKYAAILVVDHGGFGGSVAGPLMKRVMTACKEIRPSEIV